MTLHPSIDGTRLEATEYLDLLDLDFEALLEASGDLGLDVPGCPGWTIADLLSHLVSVLRRRVVSLDLDAAPEGRGWGEIAEGMDVRDVLREVYGDVCVRLRSRDQNEKTWSFRPEEQTVGFWHRRLAHEISVHRWDAQSASRGIEGADPIDPVLASDGIDELLGWLMTSHPEYPQAGATGQTVLMSAGEHSWRIILNPMSVEVVGGSGDAGALMAAEPSGLLLEMWGRPGEHGVATMGDPVALRLLREHIAARGF
ncbi:unannotated protein [freshwater metagenome]|uniref:Unannotated protein n=1 Tax=freshwater metagenome TaxID=449393 RepID=A0A6J7C4V3_9ZZZZ